MTAIRLEGAACARVFHVLDHRHGLALSLPPVLMCHDNNGHNQKGNHNAIPRHPWING